MIHARARLAVAFAAAVAATVATLLVWQENVIGRVRADNRALAARAAPPDQSRVEPNPVAARPGAGDEADQAARDRAELDRLRNDVAALRAQLQQAQTAKLAAVRAAATTDKSRAAKPPGFVSLQDARDVGAATPEAMFQTFAWAMRTADTNRIIQLADWSAEGARGQAEEMLRELPKAIATGEIERDAADKGFRVVRQVPLPDGDVAMVLDMVDKHGEASDSNRMAVRIRRVGNEWRIVMGKGGPEEVKLSEDQMGD